MKYNETKCSIIADYYSEHYNELKGYVAVRTQFADETEDIVQNVFLRILRMDKMITPLTLPCLAYTVAQNLVYDYWRHQHTVEEYEHIITQSDWRNSCATDVESVYSARELSEILEQGVAHLTEAQRKVYRMNFNEGKKVSEIATTLQMNYKSVENRLGDARKQVRNYVRRMLA